MPGEPTPRAGVTEMVLPGHLVNVVLKGSAIEVTLEQTDQPAKPHRVMRDNFHAVIHTASYMEVIGDID